MRTKLALALGQHGLLALLQQRLLPQRLLLVPLWQQRSRAASGAQRSVSVRTSSHSPLKNRSSEHAHPFHHPCVVTHIGGRCVTQGDTASQLCMPQACW